MHRPAPHAHPAHRGRARPAVVGLGLALALGLSACSSGGATTTAAQQAPSGGSEGAGESTAPTTAPATTASGPERALAGRDASIDGKPVRFELVSLKRSGATLALTARLSTTSDDEALGAQIGGDLSDAVDNELAEGDETEANDVFDGVSLVDGKNRKRYLTARDSSGRCVCDGDLGSAFVEADAPIVLSATYGAPPADVRAVDVVVPKFGTFTDVPLS